MVDFLRSEHVMIGHGTGFNWPRPDHLRIVTLPSVDDLGDAIGTAGPVPGAPPRLTRACSRRLSAT